MRLILLPGMDGTGDLFGGFLDAIPASLEATIMRYSRTQVQSYEELEALLEIECQASGSFVLIAESYSSPLALRYAASNPENLRGTVLCAGFATSPVSGWRRDLTAAAAPYLFRFPIPRIAVRQWLLGTTGRTELVEVVKRTISQVRPHVLTARLREVLKCDVRKEAAMIRTPLLYMQGREDLLITKSSLDELLKVQPKMRVVRIDSPHLVLQSNPIEAANAVIDFVDSLPS